MAEPLVIEIDATHLYPGAIGRCHDALPAGGGRRDGIIVFSDTATSSAVLALGRETRLDVGAYTTAAGARIAAKQWLVTLTQTSELVQLRVVRRIVRD